MDHYVRLERGKETRPSPSVVDSPARALLLEEAEHQHLRSVAALAQALGQEQSPTRRSSTPTGPTCGR
jgi:hypothetical protein